MPNFWREVSAAIFMSTFSELFKNAGSFLQSDLKLGSVSVKRCHLLHIYP